MRGVPTDATGRRSLGGRGLSAGLFTDGDLPTFGDLGSVYFAGSTEPVSRIISDGFDHPLGEHLQPMRSL